MIENYYEISPIVEKLLLHEKPSKILEISGFNCCYGNLFKDFLRRQEINGCRIDRIFLADGNATDLYDNVYPLDILNNSDEMPVYDFIFIAHLLEYITIGEAQAVLELLQTKVAKQILVITPEHLPGTSIRAYHPSTFHKLDISFRMLRTHERNWQLYSVFSKIHYTAVPLSSKTASAPLSALPQQGDLDNIIPFPCPNVALYAPLNIVYILPHKLMTEGMRTLIQHIRLLAHRGHNIKIILRSNKDEDALVDWSGITDADGIERILIPGYQSFACYAENADVVVITPMTPLSEFFDTQAALVLWTEGSKDFFGDYGKPLYSDAPERMKLHNAYRRPVHSLTASRTLAEALEARFALNTQLVPHGVDTELFHPSAEPTAVDNENPANPVILYFENAFAEGYPFILKTLQCVWKKDIRFRLKWVCNQPLEDNLQLDFPVEFHSRPTPDELSQLFQQADILFYASPYETFALPILEAMASGVAVAAEDNDHLAAFMHPGENCLTCDRDDVDSMTTALIYLLTNPASRQSMADAARKTALEFPLNNLADCLETYFYGIARCDAHTPGGVSL